jgi:hypothetical protein
MARDLVGMMEGKQSGGKGREGKEGKEKKGREGMTCTS